MRRHLLRRAGTAARLNYQAGTPQRFFPRARGRASGRERASDGEVPGRQSVGSLDKQRMRAAVESLCKHDATGRAGTGAGEACKSKADGTQPVEFARKRERSAVQSSQAGRVSAHPLNKKMPLSSVSNGNASSINQALVPGKRVGRYIDGADGGDLADVHEKHEARSRVRHAEPRERAGRRDIRGARVGGRAIGKLEPARSAAIGAREVAVASARDLVPGASLATHGFELLGHESAVRDFGSEAALLSIPSLGGSLGLGTCNTLRSPPHPTLSLLSVLRLL